MIFNFINPIISIKVIENKKEQGVNLQKFIEQAKKANIFYDGEVKDIDSIVDMLSPSRPLLYWTMELYDKEENEIKGGGGLGILAADTRRTAQQLGIPLVVVTPFYTRETHQRLDNFWQQEESISVKPGPEYRQYCNTSISTLIHNVVPLDVYDRTLGSTRIVTITEKNFGELYPGSNSSDHRLYQEVALGFGGYKALRMEGIEALYMQLNEAPTVFAAIARLDDLLRSGQSFEDALKALRSQLLYTNHTLVPAVEGEFTRAQFEHFAYPNILNNELKEWLNSLFNSESKIKLSLLAVELAGKKSGVSKLHARVSDFYDHSGNKVKFDAITNGISRKWILPGIENFYHKNGILNETDLPSNDYKSRLNTLDMNTVRQLKKIGRAHLNHVLRRRKNQYNCPTTIPHDAIIFDFKRRFASYKRPDLLFTDTNRLSNILQSHNAHLILTGKPHPNDEPMKHELQRMLTLTHNDPILRQRVHYIQDYDEEIGQALAFGADCALNVPVVGEEACGTSWMKDIANLKLLISTPDGGVADVQPIACLEVSGKNEAESLYYNMEQASAILRCDSAYRRELIRSLGAYLPIISGPRMMAKYLQLFANR